mmetsp:Transcript_28840/g.83268  ORF Transcript_28840/g.83268 Transcript_28840/m.83268 type:complete len:100 (+) Transcript_28840:573-872(+)
MCQQQVDELVILKAGGSVESRELVICDGICIGSAVQQRCGRVDSLPVHSQVQRRPPVIISGVWSRAESDELADGIALARGSRQVQWGAPTLLGSMHRRP